MDLPRTESSQEDVMFSFLLNATQLYVPESSSVTLLISRLLPPSSVYFLDLRERQKFRACLVTISEKKAQIKIKQS